MRKSRPAIANNLCRCGIYDRILRAVKRAAGDPLDPPSFREGLNQIPDSSSEPEGPDPTDGLAGSLMHTPDLDSWVRINRDETVTIFTGKAELGQDIKTSVAMIGAEELDLSLDRIRVVTADTAQSPNEGTTASSLSLETSGNAIRNAAAEARQILLEAAGEKLDAPMERLTVQERRTITDPATGRQSDLLGAFRREKIQYQGHGDRFSQIARRLSNCRTVHPSSRSGEQGDRPGQVCPGSGTSGNGSRPGGPAAELWSQIGLHG